MLNPHHSELYPHGVPCGKFQIVTTKYPIPYPQYQYPTPFKLVPIRHIQYYPIYI